MSCRRRRTGRRSGRMIAKGHVLFLFLKLRHDVVLSTLWLASRARMKDSRFNYAIARPISKDMGTSSGCVRRIYRTPYTNVWSLRLRKSKTTWGCVVPTLTANTPSREYIVTEESSDSQERTYLTSRFFFSSGNCLSED